MYSTPMALNSAGVFLGAVGDKRGEGATRTRVTVVFRSKSNLREGDEEEEEEEEEEEGEEGEESIGERKAWAAESRKPW